MTGRPGSFPDGTGDEQQRGNHGQAGRTCPAAGLDRNPLRRRIDRLQAALMAGLLAAFLAGAPLLTIAAAGWVHAVGTRERHAQRSLGHHPYQRHR